MQTCFAKALKRKKTESKPVVPPPEPPSSGTTGAEVPEHTSEDADFLPKATITREDLELMRMNTGSQIPSEASVVESFVSEKVWNS